MKRLWVSEIGFFVICFASGFGDDTQNLGDCSSEAGTEQSTSIRGEEIFQQFISKHVPWNERTGKIDIPAHVKHIKLDIGLSYSAPMSQYWLSQESDLLVFGFEPNPASVNLIKKGAVKQHPAHGEPLDIKFINKEFFIIPCALGLATETTIPFYITRDDCGCSSIYEPNSFAVSRIINVPFFRLSDFFAVFPFDTHPVIEYIKIDAQGSDLNIVKSAGEYLRKHVVFITIEPDCQYKNAVNSEKDIEIYMKEIGFNRYYSKNVSDPTFLNTQFADYARRNAIRIYQRG